MKILKVVYNNNCKSILNIIDGIDKTKHSIFVEVYNINNRKDKKEAQGIMTRFGTKLLPLIVFEDENLKEYNAIWSERNPDWAEEINKILADE